jgi:hypothetical protein
MSYVAPSVTATGLQINTYPDILAWYISQFQAIYPQVVYIGTDTAIYQEISITALMDYDAELGMQYVYNNQAPLTATGAGQDSLYKLNGIARKGATYSTAPELISGVPYTVITNGLVTDTSGNIWALPTSVTIPSGGSVIVAVTCQTPGAIQAAVGTITTPSGGTTAGWTGATNPSPASPGLPVEADSQFRARQSLSVAAPSLTRLASTIAAIAAVPGVTRYATGTITAPSGPGSSIENPTGGVDSWGNPAHSISMVVEGGTSLGVATAIYQKRGLGVYTNPGSSSGSMSISITDPNTGTMTYIGYQTPTYIPIYVTMVVHGQNGYSSAVLASIQSAIVAYLNELQIGETVNYSAISAVAQSVMPSLIAPQFSITSYAIGTAPSPVGTSNISLLYYQVAQGIAGNINVSAA